MKKCVSSLSFGCGGSAHACYAGQYSEQVFKSIDFILNEMSKQGIKVIVALIDYWKKTDGVEQVRSHLVLFAVNKQ